LKKNRDYKEHGARRGDEIAASTPSLNRDFDKTVRSWTSTSNLSTQNDNNVIEITAPLRIRQRPSSWSSTPDLDEEKPPRPPPKNEEITVSVQLPVRRRPTPNTNSVEESFTLKRSSLPPPSPSPSVSSSQSSSSKIETEETIFINKTDSLAERVRKMQMMKRQGSLERDLPGSREGSVPRR
jgi:hypothetical protein